MSSYLFIFGRTPELSFAEVRAFFPDAKRVEESCALITTQKELADFIDILGGTVKIAELVGSMAQLVPGKLASHLSSEGNRLEFGVSGYGIETSTILSLPKAIKSELLKKGISSRFVLPAEGSQLGSVVIQKKNIHEFILVKTIDAILIGKTVRVQDFESWAKRDRGRPFADPQAGMLPPKVARMAVNLASAQYTVQRTQKKTLLDPFCGMGTILAEGMLRGCRVIGIDQSESVIQKTKENMRWLISMYRYIETPEFTLLVGDATRVSKEIPANSIDAIVTEPFMGKTRRGTLNNPTPSGLRASNPTNTYQSDQLIHVKNTIKGLEKLYIGCLKDWYSVLKPEGKVVIALPEYMIGNTVYFVKRVIDRCENLGYTIVEGPLEYSRPQAVVKREFFVLKKLNPTNTTNATNKQMNG